MNLLSIIGYLFLAASGVLIIFLSFRMFQKYHLKYLFFYLVFLIFYYAFNFLDIIGDYFTWGILVRRVSSPDTINTVSLAFSLLALPFIILAWFFFIRMFLEMREKPFPIKLRIGYFTLQIFLLIGFAFVINKYLLENTIYFLKLSNQVIVTFNLINHLILVLVVLWLLFSHSSSSDPRLHRAKQCFSAMYLVIIPINFIILYVFPQESKYCYMQPVFNFFIHFPAVLFLWYFFKNYFRNHPIQYHDEKAINHFFSKNGISKREQEIIHLIIKGKSNRDIEDELYISIKTVKAHVYNIYKKLGIKNRWQLINIVQNYKNGKSEFFTPNLKVPNR